MTVFKNYTYTFLDTKKQLYQLLDDGFRELQTLSPTDYKVNILTRDPMVEAGSPGANTELPCVTIFRTSMREYDQFISEQIDTGDTGNPQTGRFFDETYELRVWATTAEMRNDINYGLMKILMVGKIEYLENEGVYLVRFLDGQDGQDHTYLPGGKPLFFGILNISLVNGFIIENRLVVPQVEAINTTQSTMQLDWTS